MTPICDADPPDPDTSSDGAPAGSSYGLHGGVFAVLFLCHAAMAVFMRYPTVVYDELVYAGFARFFSGTAAMPNLYGGVYGHFGYSLLIAPLYLSRT